MGRTSLVDKMSRLSSPFDMDLVEKMKTDEAPVFHHGALIKPRPKRHCIARRHFYYNSEEWYKPKNRLPLKTESDEKPVIKSNSIESFQPESEEYTQYTVKIPSKVYADTYIRKDASKWKSTPVPGIRVCPESDQYRQQVMTNTRKFIRKNGLYFLNTVATFPDSSFDTDHLLGNLHAMRER